MFTTGTIVDLTILFIIGMSIFVGILRGATREILGIAGWIGAFATVFYGLPLFRPLGRQYIHNHMIADVIVAGLLFILSLAVFILISRTISSGVKGSLLSGLDRSLGLIFGFIRGVLIVCLIYLAIGFFYPPHALPQAIQHARFTPWVTQGTLELKRLIPKDYLPQDITSPKLPPLSANEILTNTLPTLEETVKNLSTLKPTSPKKPQSQELENLIDQNDTPASQE